MRKYEVIAALGKRGRIVVGVREHHDVIRATLSHKKIVGSLIVRAQRYVKNQRRKHRLWIDSPLSELHFGSAGC